jgi:type 1 glutamine amidotransferase
MKTTLLPTLCLVAAAALAPASGAPKRIALIAGAPSHPPGQHEHNAGMLLFQKCLAGMPSVEVAVHRNGWPQDPAALDGVDAIVIYADGGRRHPALQGNNMAVLEALAKRGGGIGFIHYGVEPAADKGGPEFLRWTGGCFEVHWSVNPFWTPEFSALPDHPIARGVRLFKARDEWYFNMRFAEPDAGLTPLLTAVPPAETMARKDGPHSGNPAVREMVAAGKKQHLAWAYDRADGGRGFGFTGGHYHQNWGDPDMRKLVLNAIVWLAKAEVPAGGVESVVTPEDLAANLDAKP